MYIYTYIFYDIYIENDCSDWEILTANPEDMTLYIEVVFRNRVRSDAMHSLAVRTTQPLFLMRVDSGTGSHTHTEASPALTSKQSKTRPHSSTPRRPQKGM